MNTVNGDGSSREHLIRQVAKRLSPELRAEYYDLLRHCRSLPQNDEMLRILNAIHLLSSLTIDVPGQMAAEREKLEPLLKRTAEAQEHTLHSLQQYQAQLDQRLARLPEEIAKRIQPEIIAARIVEGLRQQFADTTIPETSKLLRSELKAVCTAVAEFKGAAGSIINDCYGAVAEARRATQELRSEADRLSSVHWKWVYYAAGLILMMGILLGALLCWWFSPPVQPSAQPAAALVQQPTPQLFVQKGHQNSRH